MSRHSLEPRHDTTREVLVGWDRHNATFYALVIDAEGRTLVQRGDPTDRIDAPSVVLDAVRPYAVIPIDFDTELLREVLGSTTPPNGGDYA